MIVSNQLWYFNQKPWTLKRSTQVYITLILIKIPSVCDGGCFQKHISRERFGILMGNFYHVTFNSVKVLSAYPSHTP